MSYLFGDTEVAARRLKVVAEVFEKSSRAFLIDLEPREFGLALDVGCGPGYSTQLLADALRCGLIVGLDNSESFISLAQETETGSVSFCLHDVTSIPFPVGPCDLIYCRLVLSHLKEPLSLVRGWATQLRQKGLMLIEEVEWIRTQNPVFATYMRIVEAMLESQANKLCVGPVLEGINDSGALKKRASRVRRLAVENNRAATMFYLNVQSWKRHPFILSTHSSATINWLEQELNAFIAEWNCEKGIEWGIRQMVFERL